MFRIQPVSRALALSTALLGFTAGAKPIAFQGGHTLMYEYGAGTMQEAQYFYAPRYWYSVGGGWLELTSESGDTQRRITYLRANLLAKRWNMPFSSPSISSSDATPPSS